MASLGAAFADTVARRSNATALLFDETRYSFAQLGQRATAIAAALTERGVHPGDRVAVGLPNSPELVTAVLGVIHAGAVLVPLNPAYTPDELTYIVGDAGARAAIVHAEHAAILMDATLPELSLILDSTDNLTSGSIPYCPSNETRTVRPEEAASFQRPSRRTPAGQIATEIWNHSAAAGRAVAELNPEAPALIVYTSGTTGQPKGAVLSHRALLSNLTTVAQAWRWSESDRLLLTLPCFHLHGLGLGIMSSFLVGSSVALRRRFVLEEVLADLAAVEATMFFGVPTIYNRLVSLPDEAFTTRDLSRVRLWVSGSAPLSRATYERFRDRTGFALMDRYGMTECGFVLSTPYDEPRRPGTVGRPLPGISVRLVDPEAADAGHLVDVADDTQGEILIRGPNLFSGYWNRPGDTQRAFVDGYLRSGDLAVREADGMLRIVGRSSVDMIKTRGFKVGAVEIEDVLQRHRDVQEVAVVGVPDADQGERIVAAVTLKAGCDVSVETLRAYAQDHLAPHKVPAEIVFIDEIPRTGPGKFKKKELIRQLTARDTLDGSAGDGK